MDIILALHNLQSHIDQEINTFTQNLQSGTYSLPASFTAMIETQGGIRAKSSVPYSVKIDDVIYSEITGQRTFELALLAYAKTVDTRPRCSATVDGVLYTIEPNWGKWNYRGGFYIRKGLSIATQIKILRSLNLEVLN